MRSKGLFVTLSLGLGLVIAMLWMLGDFGPTPLMARAGSHTVCPAGPPDCDYRTVQEAVDAAGAGDTIKVATGVYTDIHGRPAPIEYYPNPERTVVTQVVYISKTLTIQGGYTTAFNDPPDPDANPTILDAQGQGRVLFITGDVSPTIEGLRITGGSAAGLMGDPEYDADSGGGIYAKNASPIIHHNQVFSNTQGGLYLALCNNARIYENSIFNNDADRGGGIGLYQSSNAQLDNNSVSGNTAGGGGGVALTKSSAALHNSMISGNTAMGGGGLYLDHSTATVSGTAIINNAASDYEGGGIALSRANFTLIGSAIVNNVANYAGGGLFWSNNSVVTLSRNHIISNSVAMDGGGIYLDGGSATLINNVIADNHAGDDGSGMYFAVDISVPNRVYHLVHTTLARNYGGNGSGIYVAPAAEPPFGEHSTTVMLTNTILVSHTVGISATTGNTITLTATLWGSGAWANGSDWSGESVTSANNLWDDPAFINPDARNYHIAVTSPARDAGIDAGVTDDVDGDSRPSGPGYDIGADEVKAKGAALVVSKSVTPNLAQPGSMLTYTIYVTNTGDITLHAAITDTLPEHITTGHVPGGTVAFPGQPVTWTATLAPGAIWQETIVVTVAESFAGSLINRVEVTTAEGATGSASATIGGRKVYLPLVLR